MVDFFLWIVKDFFPHGLVLTAALSALFRYSAVLRFGDTLVSLLVCFATHSRLLAGFLHKTCIVRRLTPLQGLKTTLYPGGYAFTPAPGGMGLLVS